SYNEAGRPQGSSAAIGHTVRVRDAWGRERWNLFDILGRLVQVAEPNPSGDGRVLVGSVLFTNYSYDGLDNLTQSEQGGQSRRFRHDGRRRHTQQRRGEKQGTLNDLGQWLGGRGTCGDVFRSDERSNLTSRTDARGIKAVLDYGGDPLNRLQSVSYVIPPDG